MERASVRDTYTGKLLIVRSVTNKVYNKGHRAVYSGVVVSSVTSILQHTNQRPWTETVQVMAAKVKQRARQIQGHHLKSDTKTINFYSVFQNSNIKQNPPAFAPALHPHIYSYVLNLHSSHFLAMSFLLGLTHLHLITIHIIVYIPQNVAGRLWCIAGSLPVALFRIRLGGLWPAPSHAC